MRALATPAAGLAWASPSPALRRAVPTQPLHFLRVSTGRQASVGTSTPAAAAAASSSPSPAPASHAGLYFAKTYDLTPENVDLVLEDVRPYLISDGGNVEVASVEDGVINLRLQGLQSPSLSCDLPRKLKAFCDVLFREFSFAFGDHHTGDLHNSRLFCLLLHRTKLMFFPICGTYKLKSKFEGACESCPSSTTTMKLGIERVLEEKFGDAVKEIRQVSDDVPTETTAEAVNNHLDILRPAIKNYGGSVEVTSVDGGECHVKYRGPETIGSGIKAAIKEKFPDIVNVIFTD